MKRAERESVLEYFKDHPAGEGIPSFVPPTCMNLVYSIYEQLDKELLETPYCESQITGESDGEKAESQISGESDAEKAHDFVVSFFGYISDALASKLRSISIEMNESMDLLANNENDYNGIYAILCDYYDYKCSLYSLEPEQMQSQM